jgi:hypothetical protein
VDEEMKNAEAHRRAEKDEEACCYSTPNANALKPRSALFFILHPSSFIPPRHSSSVIRHS